MTTMKPRSKEDITHASFEEFVVFLFARSVPVEGEESKSWYWNADVTFDPETVCRYYVRLFRDPSFLLERFSKLQLEQGFWAIQSCLLSCSVSEVIWDTNLPFAEREECVRSMFDLFRRLFAVESLETSVQMWWDSLCYDWHCGNRSRERGGEDAAMQDVMFQTLSSLLALDSPICQGAALHGLGHLHHPGTEELVHQYLRQRTSLSKEWTEYALAATRFEVL
jgi:hypothetical protein